MYILARGDYALRAMLAITAARGELVKAATLAADQHIPPSFLQDILLELRRADLLLSHRGVEGGYALARPATEISVGDVLRAVSGVLTVVRGLPADTTRYQGPAARLRDVWLAVQHAIGDIVDRTSLADLLNDDIGTSTGSPEAVRSTPAS
ncbi:MULTISPECIES: RrF2 family transcriptional regulator [Micromonospora]|uniref:Transcriptional regulator, BadM/Rrf2 family n=1 Tax=Micromonospora yangpuensis TaxID=683228 RepID=A0A1C6V8K4_9ACTN|nr:Rrf2 family transcriptional regulator [Micromonospora yangpuensis]GGM31865.1 Rrf2 family transcriptional regulator [Micromonospora yangpuensis]SCL62683.1 transcriptional regulator, BadM/Rrf2 family [Micromonospora yangpuensis]